MWNTIILQYRGYTNFMNVQTISKSLFNKLSTYKIDEHNLSKSSVKKLRKAQRQNKYENAIFELVKSKAITKSIFKRFLKQLKDTEHNEAGYYINYKYYDIIIEKLLNFICIIDKTILIEAHTNTMNFTYNSEKTVTNIFIPIQKLAIQEIEDHREETKKYSPYIINKLCLLNHRLNELDKRRIIL